MWPRREEVEEVINKAKELENFNLTDQTIIPYVKANKSNKEATAVATKVALINSFYNTNIYASLDMAKRIVNLAKEKQLDDLILIGDLRAVGLISKFKGRTFLSFASKYCHFHNSDAYPMLDKFVVGLLKEINGKERKLGVENSNLQKQKNDLKKYEEFYRAIMNLKGHIGRISLKDLDVFLWLCGQAWAWEKNKRKNISKEIKGLVKKNRSLFKKICNKIVS